MTKNLFDVLPVYEFEETIETSEWVKENQDIGNSGEKVVKRFLENKYNAIVTKMEDFAGYDLWVKIKDDEFAVEVKTTEEHRDTFFMTITEILKAKKLGSVYNIYRVVKTIDAYKIYILNNPIELFDIDVELLENGYENDFVKIYSNDFKVCIKNSLIVNAPCIELADEDFVR